MVETQVINNELMQRVSKIVEKLHDRAKTILMMRFDGYCFNEISINFNVSESSARVIDLRTRKKI